MFLNLVGGGLLYLQTKVIIFMDSYDNKIQVSTSLDTILKFRPITLADIPLINGLLQTAMSRTCDYTVGGIFMWIDYFSYEYCVVNDTLFIKGRTENRRVETSFMLPVGAMPLQEAVGLVLDYCRAKNLRPVFSAVPADRIEALLSVLGPEASLEELEDWSDYLYDIRALSTFTGKHLSKKRNHVNQFVQANPHWAFEPLSYELLPEVELFFEGNRMGEKADESMADYEHEECRRVLNHLSSYPFEGAVLRGESGEIVAFALGEVIGDTLYVHIEKMNHEVPGAGAMICKLYSAYMLQRHPGLRYANREEDCGDPGLRNAKMQYHPEALLEKYNVRV